jgi:hypothetical protein
MHDTPDSSGTPDFDALCTAAHNLQNKLGEQELWKVALNLPTWYFIARGTGDDAEPVIGTLNRASHLLVFTDEERAADFARMRAMRASDARGSDRSPEAIRAETAGTLEMDVPDAIAYCRDLAKAGVESALFNSGEFQFHCSLIELVDRFKRYRNDR